MSIFVIDVESDGGLIGVHSMVCFGAVRLTDNLETAPTFYGQTKPISVIFDEGVLSVSGFSREEHLKFDDPKKVITDFMEWIHKNNGKGRPILYSDNNGYDASWINYYFLRYCEANPFGWSSRRIGDIYCGMMKDTFAKWKHLRKTNHNHHPLNDAMSNAEALLEMKKMGLKINLK